MKKILLLLAALGLTANVAFANDLVEEYRGVVTIGGRPDVTAVKIQVGDTPVATFDTSGLVANRTMFVPAGVGRAGATAGWALPSAHSGFTNTTVVGLPASQTASTFVIPVTGLQLGDVVTSFKVIAQIESAGNAVTLDADLRKITNAAANATDASIGAITQVSVVADTAVATEKVLATAETIASGEMLYVLISGTTLGSTDVQLLGVELVVGAAS
jgi:hypothetical protein